MKRLENKIAVIYGNGATGGAVAKAFAKEGAQVFITGRTPAKLKAMADEITAAGGVVHTAQLDALDQKAVEKHMEEVVKKAGRVDIAYNAIGLPHTGIQGISLADLPVENFMRPITTYLQSHFITAQAAAKRMTAQDGGGLILIHTPNAGRISWPYVGGMIPTWSALEALGRSLSVEFGPQGVRSVTLLTTAILETPLIDEVFDIHGKKTGMGFDQFVTGMKSATHLNKLTTLKELAGGAVFAASEEGASLTGTILNLTAGMIVN